MPNTELIFFSGHPFIQKPVTTWLLQDAASSATTIETRSIQGEVEYLRQQLCRSGNHSQQRQAALQMAAMGSIAVEALIAAMHQHDETTQVLAAYALQKIGAAAIKALLGVLGTCPIRVRQKLLWVLYMNADEQIVDALIDCLHDSDRKVRRYAAWGLGHLQNPRAIPSLVAALNDSYGKVRFDAGMALVKIGGYAVETLLDALYNGSTRTRSQVATILVWLQNDRAVDALIDALRDANPQVRIKAASALGWMGRAQAVDALIQALYDEHPEVRMQAAQNALRQLGYLLN